MKGELPPNTTTVEMEIRIPEDSVICFYKDGSVGIAKQKIKSDNRVWKFNKYDADPFPSRLHAHDNNYGEILDAMSGYIYSKSTKKIIRKLSKKQLRFVRYELDKNNFKFAES